MSEMQPELEIHSRGDDLAWRGLQVLNALAPVHLGRGDAEGATSMLTSSFTLAHNMQDLASQITALQCMDLLHQRQAATGSEAAAKKQTSNLQYLQGKLAVWSSNIQEAQLSDDGRAHTALLGP